MNSEFPNHSNQKTTENERNLFVCLFHLSINISRVNPARRVNSFECKEKSSILDQHISIALYDQFQ